MDELMELLEGSPVGALATTEGGQPRVRPFQFMFAEGKKLWFCTSNKKPVYAQLEANPKVEYLASAGTVWARVTGTVRFHSDLEAKAKILAKSDLVRSLYKDAANPIFEAFTIEEWSATVSDFTGKPPRTFKA